MAVKKYIHVNDFCEIYDVEYATLISRKFRVVMPDDVFIAGKKRGELMVNENYFTRRKEFRIKQQMIAHDMYYFLTEYLDFKVSELARAIAKVYDVNERSLYVWLTDDLFRQVDSIFVTRLSEYEWVFNKFCRMLIRDINRSKSYKFDINSVRKILDRM